MTRAEYIRTIHDDAARINYRLITAACVEAGYSRPSRQAIHTAIRKYRTGLTRRAFVPRGQNPQPTMIDTVRDLVEAYERAISPSSKVKDLIKITERMRNNIWVLRKQLDQLDRDASLRAAYRAYLKRPGLPRKDQA